MASDSARYRFTVDDYHRLTETGILTERDHVELIEGEIIRMSPIGSRHAACVNRLNHLCTSQLGDTVIVGVQNPVRLDDFSELQPDLAVLRPRADFYASAHPQAADVLLLIEVADTTLASDRAVKLPLYARASVPEVWLIDLQGDAIERHTDPTDGTYRVVTRVGLGHALTSTTVPDLTFITSALLPPTL